MGSSARLGMFAALLLAVFGAAAAIGGVVDPSGSTVAAGHQAAGSSARGAHGASTGPHGAAQAPAAATLPGLAITQDGRRLELRRDLVTRQGAARIAFRILDGRGVAVRDFDVAHGRRLHLIVVRRDLSGFRHLHPQLAADGTWSTTTTLSTGGTYRVFADFTINGEQQTLGADLQVPGDFRPQPLPADADTVTDDRGLEVRRRSGSGGTVTFDVLRDGRVINDQLEDYLGAKGHLVTLRAGDLAYLHTHPDGERLAFGVDLPSPGRYRSWVQFQLNGQVHTAAFTETSPS